MDTQIATASYCIYTGLYVTVTLAVCVHGGILIDHPWIGAAKAAAFILYYFQFGPIASAIIQTKPERTDALVVYWALVILWFVSMALTIADSVYYYLLALDTRFTRTPIRR